MEEELITACKNPYYHKMSLDEFKKRTSKQFPEIADRINMSVSRNFIAKLCREKMSQQEINYEKSFKKGKIYRKSGEISRKNNIIAQELMGIDIDTWLILKKTPEYSRNCARKDVIKSLEIPKDYFKTHKISEKDKEMLSIRDE